MSEHELVSEFFGDGSPEPAGGDETDFADSYFEPAAESTEYEYEPSFEDEIRGQIDERIDEVYANQQLLDDNQWQAERQATFAAQDALEVEAVQDQVAEAVAMLGRREGLTSEENQHVLGEHAGRLFDGVRQQLEAEGTWGDYGYDARVQLAAQSLQQATQEVKNAFVMQQALRKLS